MFGGKSSLVIDFRRNDSEAEAPKLGVKAPFCQASYDFVLKPAAGTKQQKVTSAADAARV